MRVQTDHELALEVYQSITQKVTSGSDWFPSDALEILPIDIDDDLAVTFQWLFENGNEYKHLGFKIHLNALDDPNWADLAVERMVKLLK